MTNLLSRIIEPKNTYGMKERRFTDNHLKRLIVPLFIEQLLLMVVGLVDTMMVSHAGEAAVSGVSLDNTINNIFLFIFTALGTGGAVVVSQYIGRNDKAEAENTASQIFHMAFGVSLICTVLVFFGADRILSFLYPKITPDVMDACRIYLKIVCLSFPANAVYNAGTALFRSMGKTSVTMRVSMIMNLVNVAGNAIGIFVLKAGAAGVAWPTAISWYVAAVIMTALCFNEENQVTIHKKQMIRLQKEPARKILHIAIPNMIENGLFQASKVFLGTVVASLSTAQIAANGISQTFWSLSAVISVAMSPAFITVIGQCMGAGDSGAAEYYMHKMMRIAILFSTIWCLFMLCVMPLILPLYSISGETRKLVIISVTMHNLFATVMGPFFNPFGSGLRAAGDVRYTMYAAVISTVVVRTVLSYVLGIQFQLGVIGVTIAMITDWFVRAVILIYRFRSGRWKTIRVI